MSIHLTEKTLARLRADAKRSGQRRGVTDAGCEGLMVRASPSGKITWRGSCRDKARIQHWATHGEYGEHGLSIAAARRAQGAFRVAVQSGGPLPERKRRAKGAAQAAEAAPEPEPAPVMTNTLGALIDLYERLKGHALRSWPHGRTRIVRVFGPLFDKPLATLDAERSPAYGRQLPDPGRGRVCHAHAASGVHLGRPSRPWLRTAGFRAAAVARRRAATRTAPFDR